MNDKFVLKIEQSPVLHTKWGTAKLQKHGYYVITSRKEGNHNKLLHRLIFEDYYGPLGSDICHHQNGCKTDNCICNLQGMEKSKHSSDHKTGENNPLSKYHNLWDNSKVYFKKELLFTKKEDIGKSFRLKYNGKKVPYGYFIDPVSCEIIHDFIEEAVK